MKNKNFRICIAILSTVVILFIVFSNFTSCKPKSVQNEKEMLQLNDAREEKSGILLEKSVASAHSDSKLFKPVIESSTTITTAYASDVETTTEMATSDVVNDSYDLGVLYNLNDKPTTAIQTTKFASSSKWELGKLYTKLPSEEPKLLLTIDDGPGNYIGEILDYLKENNIKAIFFVSGDTVKSYPNIVKRQYEEGHEIGTHTYCHRSYYKLEKTATIDEMKETLEQDLQRTENNVRDIVPEIKIRFLRMPEGYYRDWVGEIAKKYGYVTLNWSAAGDWLEKPDEEVIAFFKSQIRPGTIILLHDGRNRGKRALKILKELVPYALSKGYMFVDPNEFF